MKEECCYEQKQQILQALPLFKMIGGPNIPLHTMVAPDSTPMLTMRLTFDGPSTPMSTLTRNIASKPVVYVLSSSSSTISSEGDGYHQYHGIQFCNI
jgi:hypothetical protein